MNHSHRIVLVMTAFVAAILTTTITGCGRPATSASGVKVTNAKVKAGADGLTVEQRNVKRRVEEDNISGAIKHLYVISPYSGQVLLYSTVLGKVTSSGKRLAPSYTDGSNLFTVAVPGSDNDIYTREVLEDDGTYGKSVPYIYWWDARNGYHQHFFTGGQIIHVAEQPIAVKNIVINLEMAQSGVGTEAPPAPAVPRQSPPIGDPANHNP